MRQRARLRQQMRNRLLKAAATTDAPATSVPSTAFRFLFSSTTLPPRSRDPPTTEPATSWETEVYTETVTELETVTEEATELGAWAETTGTAFPMTTAETYTVNFGD